MEEITNKIESERKYWQYMGVINYLEQNSYNERFIAYFQFLSVGVGKC